MIRLLVILTAGAALALPTASYIDDALGTGVRKLGASAALAAPRVATDEPDEPPAPCPSPVRGLTVTLNEDVVFANTEEFTTARREITLNPADIDLNNIVLAARGDPGTAARVRILAIRQPDKESPGEIIDLLYRDSVQVERDGNGVESAQFATTISGTDISYVLLIENGCQQSDSAR
jgi:hypothetical protein